MRRSEPVRVGKRGTITIPAALRQQYRLEEGSILVFEPREEGILLRPASVYPVEIYTPERKAEFLLNNAVTPEDYAWAVEEVRKMGLDPKTIPHDPPPGASDGPSLS
ncbi:MAG TPA: AbrB family transcriptional regulator [Peptococcaceae bacterium]|nr:MAG: Transcriptional regulator, AbrB family [Moorella sp. 60_41]HBT46494.1 AbrB family transcriptional regulator [Peptococcaceae bacterium]